MKRFIIYVLLIVFLFPIKVSALSASSVTVMDMDTKRVLYSYNQHEKRLIASITNIMTT